VPHQLSGKVFLQLGADATDGSEMGAKSGCRP
jgi:hypothetical protein